MVLSKQLDEIEHLLQLLAQQAVSYDRRIALTNHRPVFDSQLFTAKSAKLSDYINESLSLLDKVRTLTASESSTSLLQHQCSKLVDQYQAISTILANQQAVTNHKPQRQQRKASDLSVNKSVKPSRVELYQELSKHHDYQQKFELKINQLEQQAAHGPLNEKPARQREILKLHQRLGQCRKAIVCIEKNIEQLENGKR